MARQPIRRVSLKRRSASKCQLEVLKEHRYLKLSCATIVFSACLVRFRRNINPNIAKLIALLSLYFAYKRHNIMKDIQHITEPIERVYLRFFHISDVECPIFYRFRKDDLPRLLACLRLDEFKLNNGYLGLILKKVYYLHYTKAHFQFDLHN